MSDLIIDPDETVSDGLIDTESTWFDYFLLLKPRVMSLVIFTGLTGIILAPGDIHFITAVIALVSISLAAGASGAINMWYDADIDKLMDRTRNRPIPKGKIAKEEALTLGITVGGASVLFMGLLVNWLSASLLLITILYYIVIYTMWLKRRTPQNIVIGGAAGAFPPLIGWVAVTAEFSFLPITLFLIIFLWTPPHFWALSLYRSEEYRKAAVPMMPVVKGDYKTRVQILFYTLVLVPFTFIPWFTSELGLFYLFVALFLGLIFIYKSTLLLIRGSAEEQIRTQKGAKSLFRFSIIYLFLIFLGMIIDSFLSYPVS
tara:strand:+ start:514 stop:1461 length:948 start_codon:yes stop_codon:yes gene_type:complete